MMSEKLQEALVMLAEELHPNVAAMVDMVRDTETREIAVYVPGVSEEPLIYVKY